MMPFDTKIGFFFHGNSNNTSTVILWRRLQSRPRPWFCFKCRNRLYVIIYKVLSGFLCLLPSVCLPMAIGRPPRENPVFDKHFYLSDKMAEAFSSLNRGGDQDVFRSGGSSTTVSSTVFFGLERYDNMNVEEKVLLVDAMNQRLEADVIAADIISRKISISFVSIPGTFRVFASRGAFLLFGSAPGSANRLITFYWRSSLLVSSALSSAAPPPQPEVLASIEDGKGEEIVRSHTSVVISGSASSTPVSSSVRGRQLRKRKAKDPVGSRPLGVTKHRKLDKRKET